MKILTAEHLSYNKCVTS